MRVSEHRPSRRQHHLHDFNYIPGPPTFLIRWKVGSGLEMRLTSSGVIKSLNWYGALPVHMYIVTTISWHVNSSALTIIYQIPAGAKTMSLYLQNVKCNLWLCVSCSYSPKLQVPSWNPNLPTSYVGNSSLDGIHMQVNGESLVLR